MKARQAQEDIQPAGKWTLGTLSYYALQRAQSWALNPDQKGLPILHRSSHDASFKVGNTVIRLVVPDVSPSPWIAPKTIAFTVEDTLPPVEASSPEDELNVPVTRRQWHTMRRESLTGLRRRYQAFSYPPEMKTDLPAPLSAGDINEEYLAFQELTNGSDRIAMTDVTARRLTLLMQAEPTVLLDQPRMVAPGGVE